MKTTFVEPIKILLRSPFCSPLGLLARAVLIVLLYGLCELAGLRECTTFFSGTPAANLGWVVTASLGLAYTLVYLAFVLIAPILLLASALLKIIQRLP